LSLSIELKASAVRAGSVWRGGSAVKYSAPLVETIKPRPFCPKVEVKELVGLFTVLVVKP
jgi:hypothetical protein